MASRSRPRNGSTRGDHNEHEEEQQMWDNLKSVLRDLAGIQKEQIQTFNQIKELEEKIAERAKNDPGGATIAEINELQDLYRKHLKLSEDEKRMLDDPPHDVMNRLDILKAMREASSDAQSLSVPVPGPRSLSSSKVRKPKPLGRPSSAASSQAGGGPSQSGDKEDKETAIKEESETRGGRSSRGAGSSGGTGGDGASDSLGPVLGRVKGSSSVRSSSVASRRDGTVDRELKPPSEGGGESSGDVSRGIGAEKAGKLIKGAEVAYKQSKVREDGSQWIQCIITNVLSPSINKRYEVQDPEPEEGGQGGTKYRTSASALIAIPSAKEVLPDYPIGKQVLARYPETTTFYRADVLGTRKEKNGDTVCLLRFEDDQDQQLPVLRRYVLEYVGGK